MKKPTKKIVVETNDITKELNELKGKSSQIRYLDSIGKTRKEIVDIMSTYYNKPIRYQHIRNVLVTMLKKDMVGK